MPMIQGCYVLVMVNDGQEKKSPVEGSFEDRATLEKLGRGIATEMNGGKSGVVTYDWWTPQIVEVAGLARFDEDAIVRFAAWTKDADALRGALRAMSADEVAKFRRGQLLGQG